MIYFHNSTNSVSDWSVYLTVTTDSVSVEVLAHFILLTTGRSVERFIIHFTSFFQLQILREVAAPWLNEVPPRSSANQSNAALIMTRTIVSRDGGVVPLNPCLNLGITKLLSFNKIIKYQVMMKIYYPQFQQYICFPQSTVVLKEGSSHKPSLSFFKVV